MIRAQLAKATLGRLPGYLEYLRSRNFQPGDCISATVIARELGLGEVQVRKDLGAVSGAGRPKIGYDAVQLMEELENCLNGQEHCAAAIVGAGRLGRALLDYEGFERFGIEVLAAFDRDADKLGFAPSGKPILPSSELESYMKERRVRIGIVAVGAESAQEVCDALLQGGAEAIWSFAPARLRVPEGVCLQQENLALSLAHLKMRLEASSFQERKEASR